MESQEGPFRIKRGYRPVPEGGPPCGTMHTCVLSGCFLASRAGP
jgi:hypothetical protein